MPQGQQENTSPLPQDLTLRTGGELLRGMRAAGFQDFDDQFALTALGETWGGDIFRSKLRKILTKQPGYEQDLDDFSRGVKCLSVPVANAITKLVGHPVELSVLAGLSKTKIADSVLLNLQIAEEDFNAKKQITDAVLAVEQGLRDGPSSGVNTSEHGSRAAREFKEHHIYGSKGALCFSAAVATDNKTATIRLEAALVMSAREYNWKNKVAIQLSQTELVELLAVMQGWSMKMQIRAHGQQNDKNASIERQAREGIPSFYVTVNQGSRMSVAVPIPFQYSVLISSLLLKQMHENDPHMSVEMLYRLSRSAYHLPVDQAGGGNG